MSYLIGTISLIHKVCGGEIFLLPCIRDKKKNRRKGRATCVCDFEKKKMSNGVEIRSYLLTKETQCRVDNLNMSFNILGGALMAELGNRVV